MPSQLLQIWEIFPAALGLFAIWSTRLPQMRLERPNRLRLTSHVQPTGQAPCRQKLSAMRRQLAPPLAKPTETINQTVNSYSPKRIAKIDCAPSFGETYRNDQQNR